MTGTLNTGPFPPKESAGFSVYNASRSEEEKLTINTPAFWALPRGSCPYQNDHRLQSSDKLVSSDPDPWNIQVCLLICSIRNKTFD